MREEIREGILQGVNQILLHNLDSNYFNPSSSKEYREWLEKEVSKEIIKPLHSQGVVIKVERELPKVYDDEHPDGFGLPSWCTEAYKKAGYEATISLIDYP